MINFRKILEETILAIDTTLYIDSVEVLLDGSTVIGYKFYSCDTIHLRAGKTIEVVNDGNDVSFTITEVSINEWVQVGATTILEEPFPTTATTYPIFFYSGKLSDTANERSDFNTNGQRQTPFWWSREPYDSSQEDEFSSSQTFSLVAYLLDDCKMVGEGNPIAWKTATHHHDVIEPMNNIFESRILKKIKKTPRYFIEYSNLSVRPHPYLGQEDIKGSTKALFDEKLSGIEVRIDLKMSNFRCCE